MSAMSDYLEDALRNWFKGTALPAVPTNFYCALFTVTPSDSGGGTEVSGNAYARQALSPVAGTWTNGSAGTGQTQNTNAITFPAATPSGWGTIVAFGIFDALTTGNLIVWGALSANKTVGVGDIFQFAAGALSITFA